jgi:uncharacterized protein DUF1801
MATSSKNKIANSEVAAVFSSYPKTIRARLMFLRQLVFDTAAETQGVGELEETLKWGEPSYLTPQTRSGSTVRIDWKKNQAEQYAMYFKCTANLVVAFRERFPTTFRYGENRSIIFDINEDIPVEELKSCIALALTYHLNKKLETSARWAMVERSPDKPPG